MPRELQQRLLDFATREIPNEAVALLTGPSANRATDFLPLPNIAPEYGFFVPPRALYDALTELDNKGLVQVATFHSHPCGGANLSSEDIQYLSQWDCYHLVAAVGGNNGPDKLAAFLIDKSRAIEVPVHEGSDPPAPS